jgi:hypothetical protein
MDLRKLDVEEMGEVSKSWVTAGSGARTAIEKTPMTVALLPTLEQVHAGIVAVAGQAHDPELKELSMQGQPLDVQHDGLLRGMYEALTTLSKISTSGDQLIRLRDQLLPEGLLHNQKSHLSEAGHAAAVASTMTDELRARMKAIPLGEGTVLDLYDQWQGVAKQLGAVEAKLAQLKHPTRTLAAQTQAARRAWIRWTKILMSTAENAAVSPETDALLFAPLREAMQKADARWSNSPKSTPPAPAPAKE